MASNHIVTPVTTTLGSSLSRVVSSMREAHSLLNALATIVATYSGDYVSMAADFGFTGEDAVSKMTAVALLAGTALTGDVNGAGYVTMINRLG